MYQKQPREETFVSEQNLVENSGNARSGTQKLCTHACRNVNFPIFLLVILLKIKISPVVAEKQMCKIVVLTHGQPSMGRDQTVLFVYR